MIDIMIYISWVRIHVFLANATHFRHNNKTFKPQREMLFVKQYIVDILYSNNRMGWMCYSITLLLTYFVSVQ